jgi:hypothetical protein
MINKILNIFDYLLHRPIYYEEDGMIIVKLPSAKLESGKSFTITNKTNKVMIIRVPATEEYRFSKKQLEREKAIKEWLREK